ncbi:hypothetical protein F5Y08DRAFT_352128 [Xylaria arbuscula]|nr:hypothetical protein F5Y08DRAFT_352128 [Xylaria arbuscula]
MPRGQIPKEVIPTLKDLSTTFVLSSSASGSSRVLSEIPKALSADDPCRKRRAHLKSRAGCENCRRRRVKCSEETPCANCIRRGDLCQRDMQRTSTLSIPRMSTHTRQTLMCGQEAWDHVLQLAFEYDYLMNAILCVAARHLSIIRPDDPTYGTVAANHLCRASSGLRNELSKGGDSMHLDSFLATSVLIYYDTWTNTDYFLPRQDGDIESDAWTDRVFEFSSSLKKILLNCFQRPWEQPSVFRRSLVNNPADELASKFDISFDEVARIEMLNEPLAKVPDYVHRMQGTLDAEEDVYAPVARRLCLILPLLSQYRFQDSTPNLAPSSMMPLLAKFILSFPLLGWSAFPTLIKRGDLHALFLLYHFYRTSRMFLSHSDWWWARKRATVAEAVLRERLLSKMKHEF